MFCQHKWAFSITILEDVKLKEKKIENTATSRKKAAFSIIILKDIKKQKKSPKTKMGNDGHI